MLDLGDDDVIHVVAGDDAKLANKQLSNELKKLKEIMGSPLNKQPTALKV